MPAARLALLTLALTLLGGCAMKRTLTIDSNPSGATIWVNGVKQAGTTPVQVPFIYYGYFDVRVEKEGYQSVITELRVDSKIDGYPVVDLPFEVLGGHRRFNQVVTLKPLVDISDEAGFDPKTCPSLANARRMRDETRKAVANPDLPGRQAPEILR